MRLQYEHTRPRHNAATVERRTLRRRTTRDCNRDERRISRTKTKRTHQTRIRKTRQTHRISGRKQKTYKQPDDITRTANTKKGCRDKEKARRNTPRSRSANSRHQNNQSIDTNPRTDNQAKRSIRTARSGLDTNRNQNRRSRIRSIHRSQPHIAHTRARTFIHEAQNRCGRSRQEKDRKSNATSRTRSKIQSKRKNVCARETTMRNIQNPLEAVYRRRRRSRIFNNCRSIR